MGTPEPAGPEEWAARFDHQSASCAMLGSPLWAALLGIVRDDLAPPADGSDVRRGARSLSWSVLRERAELRFGQLGPLRLAGAAHRVGLSGAAPEWAALLPSCGGTAPADDDAGRSELRDAWFALVAGHREELVAGLDREVQTNEVGRAAPLCFAHAVALARIDPGSRTRSGSGPSTPNEGAARSTRPADAPRQPAAVGPPARLVEIGCSGGLNLRLDRFRSDLSGSTSAGSTDRVVLGDPQSRVRLAPEVLAPLPDGLVTVPLVERIGIDPHPIDPTSGDGRLTLLSFVWPDQSERFERLAAAIDLAGEVPATLVPVGGATTADVLDDVLAGAIGGVVSPGVATIVQHSIVWQYIPIDQRPAVTAVLERAGRGATPESPLVWVRFEPDEWDRTRVAVWVRRWPEGGDRLVAHADFHGRWIAPVPSSWRGM